MDGFELKILGPLELWRDGVLVPVPAARQRDLLVALGLRAGRAVPVDRLVRLLWGDRPPATARGTLQSLVLRLRRLLVLDVLQTRPGAYLLAVEPERLDAQRFEILLRSGREALARHDYEVSVRVLDEALALWRGPALSDVTSDELRLVEQRRLAELHQEVVESRVEARLARGEHAALVAELRALVAAHPLRERPHEQLMIALYRDGRRAEALATYQALRQTLIDELGIEPGEMAQRLHQTILRGEPALDRAATAVAQPLPVPAQLPAEVAGFVGRAEQLAELDRCRDARLVAVVGTAGVGKTALAVRWAHQARERFPDGQLYVDLCGFSSVPALSPVDVLARFLRDLGVPPPQVPTDESEAAARYRSLLADRRLLVLLDNARDAAQVRSLLPGGGGCLTVVTSRDRLDPLVAREGATRVRLEPLPADESQALLSHALGPGRVADESAAASELARLCAHLPLAMRIAVAGMVSGQGSLAGYVARLRERGLDGLALATEPPVRATFDLSYAAMAGAAQRLFGLLGCVAGVDLTAESAAALAGIDRPTAHRLLDQLAAAHLLAEAGSDRFTCHDLLRDYAEGLATGIPAAERAAAAGRLVGWYVASAEAAADLVRADRLRLPPVPVDALAAPRATDLGLYLQCVDAYYLRGIDLPCRRVCDPGIPDL